MLEPRVSNSPLRTDFSPWQAPCFAIGCPNRHALSADHDTIDIMSSLSRTASVPNFHLCCAGAILAAFQHCFYTHRQTKHAVCQNLNKKSRSCSKKPDPDILHARKYSISHPKSCYHKTVNPTADEDHGCTHPGDCFVLFWDTMQTSRHTRSSSSLNSTSMCLFTMCMFRVADHFFLRFSCSIIFLGPGKNPIFIHLAEKNQGLANLAKA